MPIPSIQPSIQTCSAPGELQRRREHNHSQPVCLLSTELLSSIFIFGQIYSSKPSDPDDGNDIDSNNLDRRLPFEIAISHVCSHFRNVATSTRRLWSTIRVTSDSAIHEVAPYLCRSQGCPLDVHLDLSGFDFITPQVFAKINLVLSHIHCCGKLSINISQEFWDKTLMQYLHNLDAPMLRHLSISVEGIRDVDAIKRGVLRGGAPELSFVRLQGLAMSLFRPPLNSVSTLHLHQTLPLSICQKTFRSMLTASPSLTNLSIHGDIINHHTWPLDRPVEVPKLRCLRIWGVGGEVYSGILLGIDAPILESLVLKDLYEHDLDEFWASPDPFKFPQIRYLTFCNFEVSPRAYQHFFEAFPAVKEFTTTYNTSTSGVFAQLVQGKDTKCVPWPLLQTLAFVELKNMELLHNVVKKRQDSGHPLGKVRLGTAELLETILQQCNGLEGQVALEVSKPSIDWGYEMSDSEDDLFIQET